MKLRGKNYGVSVLRNRRVLFDESPSRQCPGRNVGFIAVPISCTTASSCSERSWPASDCHVSYKNTPGINVPITLFNLNRLQPGYLSTE